jgi:hypothetical protein
MPGEGKTTNITLSEQLKKYHTVGTVQKISHCRNSSKNITLSEQFKKYHTVGIVQNISHCRNSSTNITLSEQFQNPIEMSHCWNNSKIQ